MKASVFRRMSAYFIDLLIISIIVSIITAGMSTTKQEEILEKQEEIIYKYEKSEITITEYNKEIGVLSYDLQKANIVPSIITLTLSIAYFIVFQFLNKGQTIGKKFLRIKIQEKGKDPSLKSIIIRTIIVNGIFGTFIAIILVYILNRNNFYNIYSIVSSIESIFIIVSALFILYRKDKLGLHDIIAHTEVIDERGI